MSFKIKLLLASFILIVFQKSSCMQQALSEIGSSAIAGAAARTLIFENLPGVFMAPRIKNIKDKIENKKEKDGKNLENEKKVDLKKWAHRSSALINCLNILLSSQFIFKSKQMNVKAQWGFRWLYLIPAILASGIERETISFLKDTKMLKKHEELVDMSMPAFLLALQYMITKN